MCAVHAGCGGAADLMFMNNAPITAKSRKLSTAVLRGGDPCCWNELGLCPCLLQQAKSFFTLVTLPFFRISSRHLHLSWNIYHGCCGLLSSCMREEGPGSPENGSPPNTSNLRAAELRSEIIL